MKYVLLIWLAHLLSLGSIDSFTHKGLIKYYTDISFRLHANKNNTCDDKNNAGLDGRYPHRNEQPNMDFIKTHIHQLYVLRLLQDNNVNIYIKIQILNKYDEWFGLHPSYASHLEAGGLFKNWNWDKYQDFEI